MYTKVVSFEFSRQKIFHSIFGEIFNFHEKKNASCLSRELQNMASRRNGAENTNKLLQIFVQIETFTTTFAPTQNTNFYRQFVTLALKKIDEKSTKVSY